MPLVCHCHEAAAGASQGGQETRKRRRSRNLSISVIVLLYFGRFFEPSRGGVAGEPEIKQTSARFPFVCFLLCLVVTRLALKCASALFLSPVFAKKRPSIIQKTRQRTPRPDLNIVVGCSKGGVALAKKTTIFVKLTLWQSSTLKLGVKGKVLYG